MFVHVVSWQAATTKKQAFGGQLIMHSDLQIPTESMVFDNMKLLKENMALQGVIIENLSLVSIATMSADMEGQMLNVLNSVEKSPIIRN